MRLTCGGLVQLLAFCAAANAARSSSSAAPKSSSSSSNSTNATSIDTRTLVYETTNDLLGVLIQATTQSKEGNSSASPVADNFVCPIAKTMAQGLKLGDSKTGNKESLDRMLSRAHSFDQVASASKIEKCQGIRQFKDGFLSLSSEAATETKSAESKATGTKNKSTESGTAESKTASAKKTSSAEQSGSAKSDKTKGNRSTEQSDSAKSDRTKGNRSNDGKTSESRATQEGAPSASSKDQGQGFGGQVTVTKTGSRQTRSMVTVYKTTRPAARTQVVTASKQNKRAYQDDRTIDILTNSISQVLQIVTDNGWQVTEVDQKYLCPLIANSANATKFVNQRLKELKKSEGTGALSDPNSPIHRHAQTLANAGYSIVTLHTTKNYTCDGVEQMKMELDDLQEYASIMSISNPMSATGETTDGVETGASADIAPRPFAGTAAGLLALLLCLLTVILA